MFVVRYLIVAVLTIVAVLVWGVAMDYSAWTIAGLAFAAVFVLQMLILIHVIVTVRRRRSTRAAAAASGKSAKPRRQLFILNK